MTRPQADAPRLRIAYVVHDLNDSAVARRVRMMRTTGAEPIVLGFRRGDRVPDTIDGAPVVDLGRTADARLLNRAVAVATHLLRPGRMLTATRDQTLVIGRNLEALALAARIRRALPGAALVYECLDIHRLLLGTSLAARAIQRAEAALLKQVDLTLTSSPAFQCEYFSHRPTLTAPVLLLENKLLALGGTAPVAADAPDGPPWTIAWFGMLRCAKTFATLADLVARHDGRVRVEIAGRASPAVFPDFARQAAAVPHFTYRGAYRPEDLPSLYARCHFAWAIDYFEEGLNSRWLLPNRLYEAASFGVVPIALEAVETGRWLARHDAGITIGDVATLDALLTTLDTARYNTLRSAVARIPRTDVIATEADCDALIDALGAAGARRRSVG